MTDERPSFWTTLPGVLTGLAAVITALVGAAALIIGLRDGGGTTPSMTESSGSASDSHSSRSPGSPGADTVEMEVRDALDVDTGVVGNDVDGADVTYDGNFHLHGTRHAIVRAWTDQAGCTEALGQRSDDFLDDERFGEVAVCMLTDEEALAQIRPSTPGDSGRITVDVVVWE